MILPISIGVLTYVGQRMMTKGQEMPMFMKMMPVIMVAVCFTMPAGVLLYWVASQLISNIQQYFIFKNESVAKGAVINV